MQFQCKEKEISKCRQTQKNKHHQKTINHAIDKKNKHKQQQYKILKNKQQIASLLASVHSKFNSIQIQIQLKFIVNKSHDFFFFFFTTFSLEYIKL